MSQSELLSRVVRSLERLGIPHMLTGSMASSLQGEPRATHDIDLVVDLTVERVDELIGEFPEQEFYVDRESAKQAVTRRTMFNVIDVLGGEKIDFWLVTDDAFDRSRFARRQRISLPEGSVDVSSPEDTILMKLRWGKASGGSEKQFGDALRVFELQRDTVDLAYLESWIDTLGLRDSWKRLLVESQPLE